MQQLTQIEMSFVHVWCIENSTDGFFFSDKTYEPCRTAVARMYRTFASFVCICDMMWLYRSSSEFFSHFILHTNATQTKKNWLKKKQHAIITMTHETLFECRNKSIEISKVERESAGWVKRLKSNFRAHRQMFTPMQGYKNSHRICLKWCHY